jgi:hypothetical protein
VAVCAECADWVCELLRGIQRGMLRGLSSLIRRTHSLLSSTLRFSRHAQSHLTLFNTTNDIYGVC